MEMFIVFGGVGIPLLLMGIFAAYMERRENRKEREADLRKTQEQ